MKILVAGWFSFEHGSATAGDLLACELTCEWLESIGCDYDLALAPPFHGGVNWRLVDPKSYSQVIFVCGPFQTYPLETQFLEHFAGCRTIGLNLTMPIPLDEWNPFDLLLERDSSHTARPDMAFLSRQESVPVVGICLVEPYGAMEASANAAIQRLVASQDMSVVLIDTRLDTNTTGLRSPAEVESLIARMDVVITTRLHGTVLAIKNGVPALAIDPEAGGAKICRQGKIIGWPVVFAADAVSDEELHKAFDYCLTEAARVKVKECRERAIKQLEELHNAFITAMAHSFGKENLVDISTGTSPTWKSRIRSSNRDLLNLETYPHSYKFESKKVMKNEKKFLKQIAQKTLPLPVRRRLKTLWQGAAKFNTR